MSVIKSKRGESDMEFIHTARELRIYTIQRCAHFPKKYTFYVGKPMADTVTEIHDSVKMANSIYPTNSHEVQCRRDLMIRANSLIQSLVSQIEVAKELFGIDSDSIKFWMEIVDKEDRLIKSVIKKDRERYKNIK